MNLVPKLIMKENSGRHMKIVLLRLAYNQPWVGSLTAFDYLFDLLSSPAIGQMNYVPKG
jgi:hypothetical protein